MKQSEINKKWTALHERQKFLRDKAMAMAPAFVTTGEQKELIFMQMNIDESWQWARRFKKADELIEECKKSKSLKDKFWLRFNPPLLCFTSKRVATAVKADIIKDYEQLVEKLNHPVPDIVDELVADVPNQKQEDQDKLEKCLQDIMAGKNGPVKIGRPLTYK